MTRTISFTIQSVASARLASVGTAVSQHIFIIVDEAMIRLTLSADSRSLGLVGLEILMVVDRVSRTRATSPLRTRC